MTEIDLDQILKGARNVEMIQEFLKWNLVLAAKIRAENWVKRICLILH